MALHAGERLGPYEILDPIGAGGMGEVYRARDARLGRDVAIKIIASGSEANSDRVRRFENEARAAGALSHSNLLAVHDVGAQDGRPYVVFELLEGETLRDRLQRGPLPPRKAVELAAQVCAGLAAAHAHGIIHRDLKPDNLFVTSGGQVKILDFGLAKLTEPLGETRDDASTRTRTDKGTWVGTPGYVSPEQVREAHADARSDLFALGAILYEMLAGQRAFRGPTPADTLSAILNSDPPPIASGAGPVPASLERICRRCLEKDPEERFQSARDVAFALEAESGTTGPAASTLKYGPRRRWIALAAVGAAILAAVSATTLWRLRRSDLPAARLVPLTWTGHAQVGASFSPDASEIAFGLRVERAESSDIWLKIVGQAEARRLTTNPGWDLFPNWSPDGTEIAFLSLPLSGQTGSVYLVSPLGGPERRLSDLPVTGGQLCWSADGRWLAAARLRAKSETTPESGGIQLVPTRGGEPRPVTFPVPPAFDGSPAFSPDGHALAYVNCVGEGVLACDLYVLSLDPELRPQGTARSLTRKAFWASGLAWTRDGRSIVYGNHNDGLWRVPADGHTSPERVELAGREASWPFTATGRDRLGFLRSFEDVDIYRYRAGAGAAPLLTSIAWDFQPRYSPDGLRIAFESGREGETDGIWLADADGSNAARLTHGQGGAQGSPSWSPDGRSIAFDSQGEDGHSDVWTIDVDGSGLRQVTRGPADDNLPSWSRDGRLLYFTSTRTGRGEIWRVGAAGGAEEQLTRGGGAIPFESVDGRTLYYKRMLQDAPLLARPVAGGEERTIIACIPEAFGYAVGPEGIFHLDCETALTEGQWRRTLRHWDARTGQDRAVAMLETGRPAPLGLSASPDGKSILYTHTTTSHSLMMIDEFR